MSDDIQLKAMAAELVPIENETGSGPGALHIIASSPKLDRDGENLWADEWETPLPDHVQIVGDHDNNHILATVGSGVPTLEADNKIHVRGSYADTDHAQQVRKLVNGKHLRHLSVAFREKRTQKGVARELINVSFVNVPSNTDCVVLDSKSLGLPDEMKTMLDDVVKDALKDTLKLLGVADDGLPAVQKHYEALVKLGYQVTLKDASGNIVTAQQVSQAPKAPPEGADPADQAKKEAVALAKAKAAAFQITSETGQYTEEELSNA